MDKKMRTLAIWAQTHKIFRLLSAETGRPIVALLHEAAVLLRERHAENQEPKEPKSIRPDYPTAA